MTENTPTQPSYWLTAGGRTFLTIWIGQFVSLIGSGLTSFALSVWIYEETGSVTQFALNSLGFYVSSIVLAPLAGVVTDRVDRRLVMILTDALAGIATLAVFFLYRADALQVWHIYAATFLNAAAGTFQWPAYSAATTMMVPKEQLGRASGMTQAADSLSSLVVPGLAGLIYVSVGMNPIFLVDIVSFLFSIFTLLVVRIPMPAKSEHTQKLESFGDFRKDLFYGWHYLNKRRGLLYLLLCYAVCNFMWSISGPLLTPMLLDVTTPDVVGLIGSAMSAGFVVGTLILMAWGGPKRRIYGIVFFNVLCGILNALKGVSTSIPLIIFGGFGGMVMLPLVNGNSQALWQSKVAAEAQGRVFAVRRMVSMIISPVATVLAGPLAERIFTPAMMPGGALAETFIGQLLGVGPGRGMGLLIVATGLIVSLVMLIPILHPRIRNVEIELPDAVAPEPAPVMDAPDALPVTPSEQLAVGS